MTQPAIQMCSQNVVTGKWIARALSFIFSQLWIKVMTAMCALLCRNASFFISQDSNGSLSGVEVQNGNSNTNSTSCLARYTAKGTWKFHF